MIDSATVLARVKKTSGDLILEDGGTPFSCVKIATALLFTARELLEGCDGGEALAVSSIMAMIRKEHYREARANLR
jgi:hypothetical protein